MICSTAGSGNTGAVRLQRSPASIHVGLGFRVFRVIWGYYGTQYRVYGPIMENQMEKKMENEMDIGII